MVITQVQSFTSALGYHYRPNGPNCTRKAKSRSIAKKKAKKVHHLGATNNDQDTSQVFDKVIEFETLLTWSLENHHAYQERVYSEILALGPEVTHQSI